MCSEAMKMSRVWAMPNGDTFSVKPIGEFVKRCLAQSKVSIDPFARNKRWATYTNDLNPETSAEYHLDVLVFLEQMRCKGVRADLVLFDPPYSPRQIKELYDSIGLQMGGKGAWRTAAWTAERDVIDAMVEPNGVVLSFGWNSLGMGKKRNYDVEEIILVTHGAAHNDTICMAERKQSHAGESH